MREAAKCVHRAGRGPEAARTAGDLGVAGGQCDCTEYRVCEVNEAVGPA